MVEKTFFSDTLKIEAPISFVFNFLTDFSERERWVVGLVTEDISPVKGEIVGTEIREVVNIHGHKWECKATITECRKDQYLKMILEDDKEKITLDYTLTEGNNYTLITETATIIEGSTLHRLLTGQEKHTLDKRLHKFKEVVEDKYNKSK